MPKVDVLDLNGKKVDEIELSESVFSIEMSEHAVYEAIKNYLANQRQGTQCTKTRAEVRGGGRKPWSLPVPFCLHGFLPPPRTSDLVLAHCVPCL